MFNDGTSKKVDQRAQPSGMPAGNAAQGGRRGDAAQLSALDAHVRLCELEPDAATRAELLGVTEAVDAAWTEGRMLPVLRSRTATIRTQIARLEYAAAHPDTA